MAERIFTKTVLASKLHEELEVLMPLIFLGIQYKAPVVTILLSQEPDATQDQIITDTVNNHVPSRKNYKIWAMMQDPRAAYIAPLDVDFDLLPLAIDYTYIYGEDNVHTYYASATINPDGSLTYSDPVIRTTWAWTHDPIGFPVYAEETVEWYYEDGTIGPAQKVVPHYFDGLRKIRKGKEVRAILIDYMQIPVSEMIVYNETVRRATEESNPAYQLTTAELDTALQIGRNFLTINQTAFIAFVEHRDLQIITDITNATDTFLDWVNPHAPPSTIRDYILAQFPPEYTS